MPIDLGAMSVEVVAASAARQMGAHIGWLSGLPERQFVVHSCLAPHLLFDGSGQRLLVAASTQVLADAEASNAVATRTDTRQDHSDANWDVVWRGVKSATSWCSSPG